MFLRRIFKGIPDVGPWLGVAELFAAIATIAGTLIALNVVPNPFVHVSSASVSGTVLDQKTGQPVPEATVQIIDGASKVIVAESVPDAKGSWRETVRPGAYTVKAVCDGYSPSQKSVTVVEDKDRVVRLLIREQSASNTASAQQTSQPAAAATSVAAAPRTVVVTVPSRGAEPAAPASAASAPGPAAAPTVSSGGAADKALQRAADLYSQDKKQEALDVLARAVRQDSSDGRLYAKLILLNIELGNTADAKDWVNEGKQKAKKNRQDMETAALQL